MKRAAIVVALAIVFSACANDFDALFSNDKQDSPKSSSGENAPVVVKPTPSGDDDDAKIPDAPQLDCGAKADPATCATSTPAGASQTNGCSGCGCDCPTLVCKADDCETICDKGTTCKGSCNGQQNCEVTAAGTQADFMCMNTDECTLACNAGTCNFTCQKVFSCNVTCVVGSTCVVSCGSNCELVTCPGGVRKDCKNGTITCNRDCP